MWSSERCVGDHCLAERNSTIIRRNLGVEEDLESIVAQTCDRAFDQIDILKRAAAEADAMDSLVRSQGGGKPR